MGMAVGLHVAAIAANNEGKQSKKTHYPRQRTLIGLAYLCVLIITQAAPFPSLAELGQ
jgi:hypothetical protein